MKFVKHFVVLTILLCAIPTLSHAAVGNSGVVQAVGGGSSAIFLELGTGAQSAAATSTPCVWSKKGSNSTTTVTADDSRPSSGTVSEQGDIWITWSVSTAAGANCANPAGSPDTGGVYNIYSYMKLDSVVGDKCFFMVDSSATAGCVQQISIAAGTIPDNLILTSGETNIPANVIASLNGKHYTYIGTDIRPEDAKFATYRLFQNCGSFVFRNPYDLGERLTYGLGYASSVTGVGDQIKSAFSAKFFNVIDFNISGNDPFTSHPVPAATVLPIGAQPIVVAVAPTGGTGIGAATDIPGFTLALFYEGVLARSTDLLGVTTANGVTTLVREPLSGTYNTMEFSNPNSSQFHTSQDDNFCNGTKEFSQTMNIASGVGNVTGARRARVIGTGEMVSTLQAATTDTLGYFFWSAGNAKGLTNVKYLTVNGVDPLLDAYGSSGGTAYTPGVLPQAGGTGGTPPLTAVSFKNLNAGDYSIWSAVRLVTGSSVPAGVSNLLTALGTQNASQHDYVAPANLTVWHAHFPLLTIGVTAFANGTTINTANDLCNTTGAQTEAGGDAGGTNVMKKVNSDFCSDFSNPQGLINKTN
jgi:hypothetical protein